MNQTPTHTPGPWKDGTLHYEETMIDGSLCFRCTPSGEWTKVQAHGLSPLIEAICKDAPSANAHAKLVGAAAAILEHTGRFVDGMPGTLDRETGAVTLPGYLLNDLFNALARVHGQV